MLAFTRRVSVSLLAASCLLFSFSFSFSLANGDPAFKVPESLFSDLFLSHPIPPRLPPPEDEAEAELLDGLIRGRVVPFRATKGSAGLDGTTIRPGDTLTRPQLFAMFMDDISSVIRKAWVTLWLPQIRKTLAIAEERKAKAANTEEGAQLALKEKARTFARLAQMSRYLVNELVQHYKPLQSKVFFKYFTEHVHAVVDFSLAFTLQLMAKPLFPVGALAYLAYEEKTELADGNDTEPQILTTDGRLIPMPPSMMERP